MTALARHKLQVLVLGLSAMTLAPLAGAQTVSDKATAVINTPSWKSKPGTYAVFETTK